MTKTCIAWYSEDEWADWKLTAADPQRFEETFEEWRDEAEKAYQKFKAEGIWVCKTPVRLQPFLKWCRENHYPPNSKVRAQYTTEFQKALEQN